MRTAFLSLLGLPLVAAHGYVKYLTLDNTKYPGYDPHQDDKMGAKRIVFGWGQGNADGTGPINSVDDKNMACNLNAKPPALVGKARAGSTVAFEWTPWVINHKGPLSAWLAPYEGDIANVNINQLKFFKIGQDAINVKNKWATDEMIANNNTWSTTIPFDIKPGNYVLRHELLALHFASSGPGGGSPQFYLACAAVNIEGTGTATPEGNTFPGAYKKGDPGFTFKLYNTADLSQSSSKNYVVPGPKVYTPSGSPSALPPKPAETISPMGDPAKDAQYAKNLEAEAKKYGAITNMINGLPMGRNGYVETEEMENQVYNEGVPLGRWAQTFTA